MYLALDIVMYITIMLQRYYRNKKYKRNTSKIPRFSTMFVSKRKRG